MEIYNYNEDGYDKDGYDKDGYNVEGFNREGINKITGTRYNIRGYDREGINKETGTNYNQKGYDKNGYDEEGYDRYGYNKDGYNIRGYDRNGYNQKGYDRYGYDKNGYNQKGYDRSGYDKDGYNTRGYDRNGYNQKGYDRYGYDKNGYDEEGFNREGINKETGTKYNQKGYDRSGYDEEGFNREGFDREGYDREGINKETGTKYNIKGYDKNGYDEKGYDRYGYDKDGYNQKGYDKYGHNKNGSKETGTRYNIKCYDKNGYDEKGYDRYGYDKDGFDKEGYNKEGFDRTQYNKYLINKEGINKITGKKDNRIILVEEWLKTTYSMGAFAVKNGMSEKEFFRLVEEVRKIYPKLIENIEEKNDRTRDVYLFKNKEIAQKLLNGELKIENFAKDRQLKCDFDLMIKLLQSKEEKIQLTSLILDYITTGNIEITDYFNMFAKGKYKKESFKDVEKQLEVIEGLCKSIPELRKSIAGIKKQKRILESYKKPFFRNEINRMGYVDPKTNKVNMVEITDEIVEDAKRYINITENFLCSKTMQAIILKIVKGEISKEQIDELYKSSGYQEKKNITSKKIGEVGFEVGIGNIDKFDETERALESIVEKEKEGEKNKNE